MTKQIKCRQSVVISDFLDQDWLAIPEGKSESLNITGHRIIVNRDPFRSTHFNINVYNMETNRVIRSANPTADDIADIIEEVTEEITTALVNRFLAENYQPNLA